jgi:hypothetical protein
MSEFLYEPYVPAYRQEVFEVLKASLPGDLTIDWFHWKHELNPFGASLAWVAKDAEGIVGCNFFMQYQLQTENGLQKALRSCESAVLPRGRRKGIFSKIVQHAQALVENGADYYTLIGTPNESSTPGFLKLGWTKIDPVGYVTVPLLWRRRSNLTINPSEVMAAFEQCNATGKSISVHKTSAYFNWRYGKETGRTYLFASLLNSKQPNGCIYKLRKLRNLNAVVVMELCGTAGERKELLQSICSKENVHLVVIHADGGFNGVPAYTLKKGSYEFIYYQPSQVLKPWHLTLGDLEDIL